MVWRAQDFSSGSQSSQINLIHSSDYFKSFFSYIPNCSQLNFMHSFMQHISLWQKCTESLRSYGCQISTQSHKERKKTMISIPRLVLQGLLCCCPYGFCCITMLTFLSAEHSEARPSVVSCPVSIQWNICVCISVCHLLPSFSVCLFLQVSHYVTATDWSCHYIYSMLSSDPSVCQEEGDIRNCPHTPRYVELIYAPPLVVIMTLP